MIYVLILARGGSKRIELKNLQLLGNKTLLEIAIEKALNIDNIKYVIVSSDNDLILESAKKYNVKTSKREKEFADDNVTINEAVRNEAEKLKLNDEDYILLIDCCTPQITSRELEEMIGIAILNNYDSVYQVKNYNIRSQKQPNEKKEIVYYWGNNRIFKVGALKKENGFIVGKHGVFKVDRYYIDINTPKDLQEARKIWKTLV